MIHWSREKALIFPLADVGIIEQFNVYKALIVDENIFSIAYANVYLLNFTIKSHYA